MSTDLYGVRVLAINPETLTLRLRVFVVYYDVAGEYHQPIPSDRSFFVRVLCDKNALGDDIAAEGIYDEEYVNANAFRFVRSFTMLEQRNVPVTDYSELHDFYYERDGAWEGEQSLAQADYDVVVTRAEYLEAFHVGQSWGTTSYETVSDDLDFEDVLHIPDFSSSHIFVPFPDAQKERSTVDRMLYSPDGARVLIKHDEGFGVFETVNWTCLSHYPELGSWGSDPGWSSAGELVYFDGEQWMELSPHGESSPHDASFGTQANPAGTRFLGPVTEPGLKVLNERGEVLYETPQEPHLMAYAGFDASGEVCFYSSEQSDTLYRVELSTQQVERVAQGRFNAIASSPDGAYVLASAYGDQGVMVIRASDGAVVRALQSGYASDYGLYTAAAWSPDGRQCLVALTDRNGYHSKVKVYGTGRALLEAEQAPVQAPAASSGGIEQLAELYIQRTQGFSSGWSSHLDEDRMNMHLTLARMGYEKDLVGNMSEVEAAIATRAYESALATQRGDAEGAQAALSGALELLRAHEVQEWSVTFVFAPLAAAHHLLGQQQEALDALERARVGLEDEANPFQKRAVLARALLWMGRTQEVRELIDGEDASWLADYHHSLLVDLIDAGELELLEHALQAWNAGEDWDAPLKVQQALLNAGEFPGAVSLGWSLQNTDLAMSVRAWLRWLEQDEASAQAAFEQARQSDAEEEDVLRAVACWRDASVIPEHADLIAHYDLGADYMAALLCSAHAQLAGELWGSEAIKPRRSEVMQRLQQVGRLDVLAGLDASDFTPEERMEWLGAQGRWEEVYEQIGEAKKTQRADLYASLVYIAGRRHDVGVMVDALSQLSCKDMNSSGLRALQGAFKQLAGGAYRAYYP